MKEIQEEKKNDHSSNETLKELRRKGLWESSQPAA